MILSFVKPKKALSTEDWKNQHSADGAPPGVYVPNMSEEDMLKWKAKVVGSKDGNHQIEIRSLETRSNLVAIVNGAMPVVIAVDPSWPKWQQPKQPVAHELKLSSNGPMHFTAEVWSRFMEALTEAREVLRLLDNPETKAVTLKATRAGQHPLETK